MPPSMFALVQYDHKQCYPLKVFEGTSPKCGLFCQINILIDSESLPGSSNHKTNSKQTNNKKKN